MDVRAEIQKSIGGKYLDISRGVQYSPDLEAKRQKKKQESSIAVAGTDAGYRQKEDSQFGGEQVVEKLYQAIHSLPIVDASLVLLALDGLSYKQMADILGITESSVGARLNRAKAKLADLLKGRDDEI